MLNYTYCLNCAKPHVETSVAFLLILLVTIHRKTPRFSSSRRAGLLLTASSGSTQAKQCPRWTSSQPAGSAGRTRVPVFPTSSPWAGGVEAPGPNGFNNMPYPPGPLPGAQWFPQGAGISADGSCAWTWGNNYSLPSRTWRTSCAPGQGNRQTPGNQPPASKPTPIGGSADKKPATPVATVSDPIEPKSLGQPPNQNATAAPSGPPPQLTPSPPSKKSRRLLHLGQCPEGASSDATKSVPTGPKNARPTQILPAVPLPAALTSKSQTPQPAAPKATDNRRRCPAGCYQAARDAVAVAMAQLGASAPGQATNGNINAMDNLTKKVNEMRVNAVRGGGGSNPRGGRGRDPRPGKVDVPDADFDFAESNAKFNKREVVKEAIAGPLTDAPNGASSTPEDPIIPEYPDSVQPAYNKSRSFFDNISSEAKDRLENNGQKPGGREWRGEEQRKNIETFGQGSVDGGFRGYRGRGRGRGGRGRGFSRGGGGRGGGGYRNRDAQPVAQ